jgi:hypothetical protein
MRGAPLRFARPLLRRLGVIVMMAAAVAFTLQGTLMTTSAAATGSSSLHHHGIVHHHIHDDADGDEHSHVVAHVHTDGTVHAHAVDDDELDDHIKEHGCACCWNMAIAIGVLPTVNFVEIAKVAGSKLAIDTPTPRQGAEPNGLRRPPRPPSIA